MPAIITDTFDYDDIVRVLDLDEAFVHHQIDALQPKYWRTSPVATHDIKGICCSTVHPVIGTVHYKLNAFGNGTELSDNQPVANKVVEVSDVLLKLVCTVNIIIIGIVTDDDTWILHHILDEAKSWEVRIRENLVWIWSVHNQHIFFAILAR